MFEGIGQSVVLLGGAAGLTFCLAGGVAVGVVPQVGNTSVSSLHTEAAQGPTAAPPTVPDTVAATTTAAPEAPAPSETTTVARPRTEATAVA